MTGRELVSGVRATHRLLSTDNSLNDRSILSEVRMASLLLTKRETNLRKLWSTDTLFSTIPCLQMKEVPISECCEYVDDCTIARSIFPLPRMSEGNYQYVIQGVYSVNAMGGKASKLKEITINRYLNLLKLPIIKKEVYFWINNNYLYITNPNLKTIRMSAFFEEDIPNEILYPECDCNTSYTLEEYCKNPLDKEFAMPGYLEKQVIDLVSQKLLSTYYRLKEDITNQGIDAQAPNTQPNS